MGMPGSSRTPAGTTHPAGTWQTFRLAGRCFAVPSTNVREIVRCEDPTPVPGAPEDVIGIANVRGSIVTVLDGCRRLGLDPGHVIDGPEARLMVLYGAGESVGMPVDAVQETLACAGGEWRPAPPQRAARADDPVLGTLRHDDNDIALLDTDTLCQAHPSNVET